MRTGTGIAGAAGVKAMKFAAFKVAGRSTWGAITDDGIVDMGARGVAPNLQAYIASGSADTLPSGPSDYALTDVELDLPLKMPRIFCIGFNYHAHRAEMDQKTAESPLIFIRSPQSVVAAGKPLWRPSASDNFDFEGELACIIGAGGRHISPDQALRHVFGYSIFNDGSIRDFQNSSITAGKNFDASGAFGPWIVDSDEAPAWNAMHVRTRLNDEVVQQSDTDLMIFGLPDLIAYISRITRLIPGDVIATGTPSGVGWKRTPPLWMKPGDTVDVEVTGIGRLTNRIIAEPS
jgi:2-keto-4-pentenoate hydratase/2-oxohepta-3-ene-1,7-dioic acid hydratase in catechol pathway